MYIVYGKPPLYLPGVSILEEAISKLLHIVYPPVSNLLIKSQHIANSITLSASSQFHHPLKDSRRRRNSLGTPWNRPLHHPGPPLPFKPCPSPLNLAHNPHLTTLTIQQPSSPPGRRPVRPANSPFERTGRPPDPPGPPIPPWRPIQTAKRITGLPEPADRPTPGPSLGPPRPPSPLAPAVQRPRHAHGPNNRPGPLLPSPPPIGRPTPNRPTPHPPRPPLALPPPID